MSSTFSVTTGAQPVLQRLIHIGFRRRTVQRPDFERDRDYRNHDFSPDQRR